MFGKKKQTQTKEKILTDKAKTEFQELESMDELEAVAIVQEKVLKSSNLSINDIDLKKLKQMAKNLALKEDIKKAYINKDFKSVIDFFKIVPNVQEKNKLLSSNSTGESLSLNDENFDDMDDMLLIEKLEKQPQVQINEKLKIKLVITEVSHTPKERQLRKILSPVASSFNLTPEFGLFHSAIIIGPWYLEWTNKSLCIPKKCFSSAALVAVDVPTNLELVDVDVVVDRISEVISRWNIFRKYDRMSDNCQLFVDDIFASLGIDIDKHFKGQIGDFLKVLRKKGTCNIEFKVSPEIQEKCEIKDKVIKFESHEQLDKFVENIEESYPKFKSDYPDDYQLLKSFDRAFWLRHFKLPDSEQYKPKKGEIKGTCGCPFGDPVSTNSLGGKEWFPIDTEIQKEWSDKIKNNQ
eukprot:gene1185-10699_t